jgi:hypothetical protein
MTSYIKICDLAVRVGHTKHCFSRSLLESFLHQQQQQPSSEEETGDQLETHTLPALLLQGNLVPFSSGQNSAQVLFVNSSLVHFHIMRRNWHSSDKCVLFGKLCAYILVVANNL